MRWAPQYTIWVLSSTSKVIDEVAWLVNDLLSPNRTFRTKIIFGYQNFKRNFWSKHSASGLYSRKGSKIYCFERASVHVDEGFETRETEIIRLVACTTVLWTLLYYNTFLAHFVALYCSQLQHMLRETHVIVIVFVNFEISRRVLLILECFLWWNLLSYIFFT